MATIRIEDGGVQDGDDGGVIPLFSEAGYPTDSKFMLFVMQLAIHDGNASAAARACGMTASAGRETVKRYPGLRELAKKAIGLTAKQTIRRWQQMHATALQTIFDLASAASDERVRLAAAQTVVERVEGKAPLRGTTPETDASEVRENIVVRFAAAYHLREGCSMTEAIEFAERNPETVTEWARKRGILKVA